MFRMYSDSFVFVTYMFLIVTNYVNLIYDVIDTDSNYCCQTCQFLSLFEVFTLQSNTKTKTVKKRSLHLINQDRYIHSAFIMCFKNLETENLQLINFDVI